MMFATQGKHVSMTVQAQREGGRVVLLLLLNRSWSRKRGDYS